MRIKEVLVLLSGFMVFLVAAAFAQIEDTGFTNQHTVRVATSGSDDCFYLTRAAAFLDYKFPPLGRVVKISPFFEYQHNLSTNNWWRRELGAEIGSSFFNNCFYWGASFQHVWQRQENYSIEALTETTEWESRFVITPSLPWDFLKDKVTLRLFDEYTYDFTRGQTTFNEVGVVFDWRINEKIRMPFGWRHTDRIHDFDADTIEFSLLFSF